METVIIGSGNVAAHMARAFSQNGLPVKQIFGRNEAALREISGECGIPYSTENLDDAELYLVCVSDAALAEISLLIKNENCLVAHTSGSMPKEILVGNFRKASFYPLQTFSKNKSLDYKKIPIFLEAENETDLANLMETAEKISENVSAGSYEKRKYIHLTAVFACNFTNHLYARAKEISDAQQVPFEYFLPLIDETVQKIHEMSPKDAQTGPAVRNDNVILRLHEELLQPGIHLDIYRILNKSIAEMYAAEQKSPQK